MELLSAAETTAYWDDRHRREGDLRSGGDVSFDEATNEMFYVRRLGILLDLLGQHSDPVAPRYLLDAGCGKGWFSRALARFGHRVDGIDASPSALAEGRTLGGGPRYHESTLADWHSPWPYDAVVSIDVLFHVLDEEQWQASLRNLAALVRLGGRLVVSDQGEPGRRVYGNYQVGRGPDRYRSVLSPAGFRADGWHPYRFRGSPIGFHAFTRTG
ncbi:class I SAM-dependent methyltransferase [Micromonospora cathayae]|uniref:Methyltransferase domain-containing protein n=1 Tax=Micromonospora cathayae TaxID=3028804 RepID=A0ABY7ZXK0_9ACTN|nr:methyltransferase domain-containing protein [Micromonospora sp. HUAS 3]WDZ87817.1 methyltransferase domain-containing protein [Micromonospora sp. HUAS 3]